MLAQPLLNRDPTNQDPSMDDRLCPGCKQSAVSEHGGLVVAFGQSFFHVDCFKCAKCLNQVTADTNLLLLSDGSPVCANCSYSCNVCNLPILDEAIMTGDDSYHAHCFKCKVCKNRINELVFAKTTQGIYCMQCHNERMIKIRRHTQKKAERERERQAAGGSGSSRSRDAHQHHQEAERSPPPSAHDNHNRPSSSERPVPPSDHGPPPPAYQRNSGPYSSDPFELNNRTNPPPLSNPSQPEDLHNTSNFIPSPLASSSSQSPSVTIAPPHSPEAVFNRAPQQASNLPILNLGVSTADRRKSFNDRPLDVLLRQAEDQSESGASSPNGLTVSTSRRNKRRSINPGLTLNNYVPATSSPTSPTLSLSGPRSPVHRNSSDSSNLRSPLHEHFDSSSADSQRNSTQSFSRLSASSLTPGVRESSQDERSRPSSPSSTGHDADETDQSQEQTIVLKSPAPPSPGLRNPSTPRQPYTRPLPSPGGPKPFRASPSLSTLLQRQTSFDNRPPLPSNEREAVSSRDSTDLEPGRSASRSASPAHQVDVPSGIESDTDVEETQSRLSDGDIPPPPPPKEDKDLIARSADGNGHVHDTDLSLVDSGSDDMSESSPVERESHPTFIAPALPPIRISMGPEGFSQFLDMVDGAPPKQTLERLTVISEHTPDNLSSSTLHLDSLNSDNTAIFGSRFDAVSEDSHHGWHNNASSQVIQEQPPHATRITVTEPDDGVKVWGPDSANAVVARLQEAISDAREQGAQQVKLERTFVEAITGALESRQAEFKELKTKFDGMKRTSKQYVDGLTVAQTEYDRELKARRHAEAEVTRLRVLLSGQAVKLTALSGDTRKQELHERITKDLHENLSGLEHDVSKLKVERDMTLAEVEELSASKGSPNLSEAPSNQLGRSLTVRLDNLKSQYKRDLVPLTQQREALTREIAELRAVRDVFLEETTVLNARNEELAQLSAVYIRRMDPAPESALKTNEGTNVLKSSLDKAPQPIPFPTSLSSSTSGSLATSDEGHDTRHLRVQRVVDGDSTPSKNKGIIKWPRSRPKDASTVHNNLEQQRQKVRPDHNFQPLSVLRVTRCDHCGDKMWGSQLRCTICNIAIHPRCSGSIQVPCSHHFRVNKEESNHNVSQPSMFGRDLSEQVRADDPTGDRLVPVLVEKCIEAVDALALDYEGIYRKTGGTGQSKAITQLFERGNYSAFDLQDTDRFNDISSVTSVLKTYFRSLPNPLLTFELHDKFMVAVQLRDMALRHKSLMDLVKQLPSEHYYTLRLLMLHLHRVQERSNENRMNARNLGVVFGPTLMRSPDPGAEFSDMAGKALSVEWLVENAPTIFGRTNTA